MSKEREFSAWFFRAPDVVTISMLSALLYFCWNTDRRIVVLETRPCPCHAAEAQTGESLARLTKRDVGGVYVP